MKKKSIFSCIVVFHILLTGCGVDSKNTNTNETEILNKESLIKQKKTKPIKDVIYNDTTLKKTEILNKENLDTQKETKEMENDANNETSKKYEIINEESYETSNKAQLTEYVIYKDTVYTESALKNVLLSIYERNKNKDIFDNFNAPTVFGIYVYTSKEVLKFDKSAWICMLTKGPLDSEPSLRFNQIKLESLQGLNDNKKSADEIALDNLNEYLEKRGLKLCPFYKQLGDMELDCIHKADAKFPNFDYPEHHDYSEKLMKNERKKLSAKYNLGDSIFVKVAVFGMGYCR